METKNLILAVALSAAVFFLYSLLAPKPSPPPAGAPALGEAASRGAGAIPAAPPASAPPVPEAPAAPARKAVLENDRMRLELSSTGAAVVRAQLKAYRDRPGKGGAPVEVLGGATGFDLAGDVRLTGGALGFGAAFQELEQRAGRVVYAWDSPAGLRVEKTYSLAPARYDVDLSVVVRNRGPVPIREQLGLLMVGDYGMPDDKVVFIGPTFLKGSDLSQLKIGDLKKAPTQANGEIPWGALLQKYFLVAAVPTGGPAAAVRVDRHRGQEKVAELELDSGAFELSSGAEKAFGFRIYLGPKLAEALRPVGSDLDRVIDYGWFSAIARPLLGFLKALYRATGNYGLAIIVLTTVVKAVFWPLSAKSFKSMQRMKDIQPKMQKLRERYGKDRERLNMEVMQLYKTHKVNPLGGCLPMLVQIPVFFALYRVLGSTIELRHAPFIFWITDLSVKDPYYVTPLIMGATMFLQQKMTPATGMDEMQAKLMMYGMPALFTFMFLNFASGLVLYWLLNNILSILQQWMMMRGAKAETRA